MRFASILLLLSVCGLQAQNFSSSNLPIIVLDTDGQSIVDEPKITAHMGIIYNGQGNVNTLTDAFNNYDGLIGIETRGNVTQTFNKLSYGIETRDNAGVDLKVSLLGLAEESDWILSASHMDKTFIRDPLGYYMSRRIGRWASNTIHCELVLNGNYQGIYILEERIKRDKNRVDIAKLIETDNSGDAVTGGYIYEVAQSGEDFGKRRRFVYPKADDITSQQTEYIRKYDDDFRLVMESSNFDHPVQGYAAWIDVDSFIDEILLQEACKNSDAYGWSSYFHKDRSGKLMAGPLWDLDQSLSNSTFNDGPNYQEWIILKSNSSYPPFWKRLFNDPSFKAKLSQRWIEIRSSAIKTSQLIIFIDSVTAVLDNAQARNFQKWKILGQDVFRSTPGFTQRLSHQQEVDYLKNFVINRLAWMDETLGVVTATENESRDIVQLQNYPNPAAQNTTISYSLKKAGFVTLTVYDIVGRKIETLVEEEEQIGNYQVLFQTEYLNDGLYIYSIQVDNSIVEVNKLMVSN